MAEMVKTSHVVIDDAEIFAGQEGGTFLVALTSPLDTQRAVSVGHIVPGALDPRASPAVAAAVAGATRG